MKTEKLPSEIEKIRDEKATAYIAETRGGSLGLFYFCKGFNDAFHLGRQFERDSKKVDVDWDKWNVREAGVEEGRQQMRDELAKQSPEFDEYAAVRQNEYLGNSHAAENTFIQGARWQHQQTSLAYEAKIATQSMEFDREKWKREALEDCQDHNMQPDSEIGKAHQWGFRRGAELHHAHIFPVITTIKQKTENEFLDGLYEHEKSGVNSYRMKLAYEAKIAKLEESYKICCDAEANFAKRNVELHDKIEKLEDELTKTDKLYDELDDKFDKAIEALKESDSVLWQFVEYFSAISRGEYNANRRSAPLRQFEQMIVDAGNASLSASRKTLAELTEGGE